MSANEIQVNVPLMDSLPCVRRLPVPVTAPLRLTSAENYMTVSAPTATVKTLAFVVRVEVRFKPPLSNESVVLSPFQRSPA